MNIPKRIRIAFPFVIIAALGYAGFSWWQSPSSVSGTDTTKEVSSVLGAETQLTNWQTAYFTTRYPANLHVTSSAEQPNKSIIGQYVLSDAVGTHGDQVAMTIGSLGNGNLSEVSAIKLRTIQPATYAQTSVQGITDAPYIFARTDGTETAVFWQHGTHYVGLVATGTPDRLQNLQQVLSTIYTNLQLSQD